MHVSKGLGNLAYHASNDDDPYLNVKEVSAMYRASCTNLIGSSSVVLLSMRLSHVLCMYLHEGMDRG